MTAHPCSKPGCTVDVSGVCAEGVDNFETACRYYLGEEAAERRAEVEEVEAEGRRFHSGLELGVDEAAVLMREAYSLLIGLVGLNDVGKTCFLTALYLLACSNALQGYRFAGSRTLYGFEERARYARRWTAASLPAQLAVRTLLQDARQGGVLHMRLRTAAEPQEMREVLLTDVPGEWFRKVIEHADEASRLRFLQRADGILFFVDGERLARPEQRYHEIYSAELLMQRLVTHVGIASEVPFGVIISKVDVFEGRDAVPGGAELQAAVRKLGLRAALIHTASFSRCPAVVPSGLGVGEAIRAVVEATETGVVERRVAQATLDRSYATFVSRGHQRLRHG